MKDEQTYNIETFEKNKNIELKKLIDENKIINNK